MVIVNFFPHKHRVYTKDRKWCFRLLLMLTEPNERASFPLLKFCVCFFRVILLAFMVLYLSPFLVAPTEDYWRDVGTASKERGNEDNVFRETDSIIGGGCISGSRKASF